MIRIAIIGLLGVVLCVPSSQPTPSFEVASVRIEPTIPASFRESPIRAGGKIAWTTTLVFLLGYAYQMHEWQLAGVPRETAFYTVQATFDEAASDEDIRLMFRKLLADRFRLVAHTRAEERSGYDLVVGKKAVKLATAPANPAAGKAAFAGKIFLGVPDQGTFAISGHGVPPSRLADQLSDLLRAFVRDRTGLTQNYFFNIRFRRPGATGGVGTESDAPTLFDVLETELGLKLEKSKGPAEILVVDRVDKVPTEN